MHQNIILFGQAPSRHLLNKSESICLNRIDTLYLAGSIKLARLGQPVSPSPFVRTVKTDTLYISSEWFKQVQCILAGSVKISRLGQPVFLNGGWPDRYTFYFSIVVISGCAWSLE